MKTNMDRNVHKFKASMVEKGFAHTQEIDYEKTIWRIAEKGSIWVFVAIITSFDYKIW